MGEKQTKQLGRLDRGIFTFYEMGLKYVPIMLMLAHWYGLYDFHANPREIMICIEENETCIAYLFFMSYIFPVLFMLPASLFFGLCWIYRLPFIYFTATCVIRLYYQSWLITNEMKDTDMILVIFMFTLYLYAVVRLNGQRISKAMLKLRHHLSE